VHVCLDAEANGHRTDPPGPGPGGAAGDEGGGEGRASAGDRGQRGLARGDDGARAWLASLAARKTPPNGVERFVLACPVPAGDHEIRTAMERKHPLLREALCMPEAEGRD